MPNNNMSVSDIFDQFFFTIFEALCARPSCVHALEKPFVINTLKVNQSLTYEFDI